MSNKKKAAFVLYDGFSALAFSTVYEYFAGQGFDCTACATTTDIFDAYGMRITPTLVSPDLTGYDLVIVPDGPGAQKYTSREEALEWLKTAASARWLLASGAGVVLLAAAGLARGKRVAAQPGLRESLEKLGAQPCDESIVIDGCLATASTTTAAEQMLRSLFPTAPKQAAHSMETALDGAHIPVTGADARPAPVERRASITRQTGETQVEVRVDIDGAGRSQVDTGLPFLDHMLTQVAVHGLFDLYIQAKGDLQIDPHHTLEDVALTLGSAFQQALGDRAGIVRMASADCPMDESLAWVAVDFSGRPYTVFQAEWHGPSIGNLPVSLMAHFFESFALNARCNLHAAVRYGRDDHHQAEALFKALGRALCAATRIDPRRAGQVPSSKGILF